MPEDGGIYHILPVLFVLTLARKLRHWYHMCQVSNCAEPKYVLKFTFLRQ